MSVLTGGEHPGCSLCLVISLLKKSKGEGGGKGGRKREKAEVRERERGRREERSDNQCVSVCV